MEEADYSEATYFIVNKSASILTAIGNVHTCSRYVATVLKKNIF